VRSALKSEGMAGPRAMFVLYVLVVAAGLVLYTVVGLSHH
jgi:hypothetical protein